MILPDYVCRNPACKSFGQRHFNCKCGPAMASGGEVTHYCSHGMAHLPECEYFANGGDVQPLTDKMLEVGDKGDAVASSLYHSGALQLLKGNMHGVYAEHGDDLKNLLSYARTVRHGSKSIDSAIDAIFDGGSIDHHNTKADQEKLHEFIEKGILNQQMNNTSIGMAHGGLVQAENKSVLTGVGPMERAFPEHNMMIQSAKTRVNNYLNSIRPVKNINKMAFDSDVEDQDKKRSYDRALDLAIKPGNVFKHLKNGSLTTEDVGHLKNIYPEVYDHLSKKMTEKIIKSQLEEKKPKYAVRQALSLFLGAHLDSSLSPQSIQAAQMTFVTQNMQKQQGAPQGSKPKKGTSTLGKVSGQYLTSEQASEKRDQRID